MWEIAAESLSQNALALEHHVPKFRFYEEVFFACVLLLDSLGLLLNRLWSQWAALILSGFLFYCLVIFSFWKLADNAEAPRFSYTHFSIWYPNMYRGQLLQIGLTMIIVSCAAASIMKRAGASGSPNDV